MTDRNVVTLLPAATEIVYALGAEPVAVSHECTYPPAAESKPRANSCVVDPDASSAAINEQLAAHDDLYEFDRETLREVDPDLVVAQGVCDVCAVDHVAVRDVVDELGLDAEVLTTDAHTLDEVLAEVRRIGGAIGHDAAAERLVAECRERIDAVRERAARAVASAGRPRALVADWMDPPMVAGHWVPGMVDLAGGEYGIAEPGEHAAPRDFGEFVAFDPEVLVVAPCGFGVEQTRRHLDELRSRDGWDGLAAVQQDAVYVMDGEVLNCPSPRLVGAVETLGTLLHPGHFDGPTEPVEAVPPGRPV